MSFILKLVIIKSNLLKLDSNNELYHDEYRCAGYTDGSIFGNGFSSMYDAFGDGMCYSDGSGNRPHEFTDDTYVYVDKIS